MRNHRALTAAIASAIIGLSAATLVPASDAAGLPRLPTELAGSAGLQIRPAEVGISGDGSSFLGGLTGYPAIRPSRNSPKPYFGRLRWTRYSATVAAATGAEWIDDGIPDEASGTFHPVTMALQAFDPRGGVFQRMRVVTIARGVPHIVVLKAHFYPATKYGPGFWQWY